MLTPEDEQKLNSILEQIKKHRTAYLAAGDVKLAQLWCALLEAKKENALLDARLKRLEASFDSTVARASRDRPANRLLESLGKF